MSDIQVPVRVIYQDNASSTGQVTIRDWEAGQRVRRAAKFSASCVGLALPAVFIPIAHFVLVPGLLIAAIVGFFLISNQQSVVLGGEASCPKCKARLPIARGPNRWPLTDLCTSCQRNVTIERLDNPA